MIAHNTHKRKPEPDNSMQQNGHCRSDHLDAGEVPAGLLCRTFSGCAWGIGGNTAVTQTTTELQAHRLFNSAMACQANATTHTCATYRATPLAIPNILGTPTSMPRSPGGHMYTPSLALSYQNRAQDPECGQLARGSSCILSF